MDKMLMHTLWKGGEPSVFIYLVFTRMPGESHRKAIQVCLVVFV